MFAWFKPHSDRMSDMNEWMHNGDAFALRGSGDSAIVAECERMYGLHVSCMEVVSEINILVFSMGNFRTTNLGRRKKMKDNSLDGNIEHSGGLSGTGSPSDSCTVVLTEIAAAFDSQLELVSGVRQDSIRFSSDGRLSCPPSFVLTLYWTRDAAESRKEKRCPLPGPRKNRKPLRCRSIRNFAKVQQLGAARGSHSAWSRPHSHPLGRHTTSRTHIKERCTSPKTSRPCLSTCKFGYSSGRPQDLTITAERVRSGYGSSKNGNKVQRGSPRRWIRRERAPATWRPRPDVLHSTHPSRLSRSYHCGARDGGARRSGCSSQVIREHGSPRRGVSASPPWSSSKPPLGQGAGHRRLRRGQNRRLRTPGFAALSGLRDARCCSEGQLLGLSDPDARPDVHWLPAEASAVIAWHKDAAAVETANDTGRWPLLGLSLRGARPDVLAVRQALHVTQQGMAQRPNEAMQTEAGS